jgi:murein DD-endopeptidase MepM/ murein hydrolase activator NlpD
MSFHIKGDDGWDYYHAHIRKVSVNNGDKVKAGQQIAEIAQSACADDTPPHLHQDRGFPKGTGGGNGPNRDWDYVPLVNKIWEGTK